MRVTKRQLRRIIREEKAGILREQHDPLDPFDADAYKSPEHGLDVPVPPADVEALYNAAEGALDQLITALSQLEDVDPQEASVMADYAAEQIHDWR
jgi:hypothetical protein